MQRSFSTISMIFLLGLVFSLFLIGCTTPDPILASAEESSTEKPASGEPIAEETSVSTDYSLPVQYSIRCYCRENQVAAEITFKPLGGTPPFMIPNYGQFVEVITLDGEVEDTIDIKLQSSDSPPLVWEDSIKFDCYDVPVCTAADPLKVTWNIVERCASREVEITLSASGGEKPYIFFPDDQYRFLISEAQYLLVTSADGQTWEAIVDPSDQEFCSNSSGGNNGNSCNEQQTCWEEVVCENVQVCRNVDVCEEVCVEYASPNNPNSKCKKWEKQCHIEYQCFIEEQCKTETKCTIECN